MRSSPLQQRSTQRIAQFLDVAAAIIGEVGYEALTMTAIAERSGASIGALYRWFPDKPSVAQELRNQYSQQLEDYFKRLVQETKAMTVAQFSEALIDGIVEFTIQRPAWLALLSSTPKPVRPPEARRSLREEFAAAFHVYAPDLTPDRAMLTANVALEIIKGLIGTFRHAPDEERDALICEFKAALTMYLSYALQPSEPSRLLPLP